MSAVSFKLMARRMMTQRARLAWDELRMIQRRMLVDFMLYDIDLTAEIAAARQAAERELADAASHPRISRRSRFTPNCFTSCWKSCAPA